MTLHDPLELELAELRPHEPSVQLKQRIAERLAATPHAQANRQRTIWQTAALVGGLLAASVAAVIVWRGAMGTSRPDSSAALVQTKLTTAFDRSLPSLWSYRDALHQSHESFDALLDQHSLQTLETNRGSIPPLVVVRFRSDMDAYLGEL